MKGQSEEVRQQRLERGCCPTHGHWMSQVDGWCELGALGRFTLVGCPRRHCGVMAIAYSFDGPWRLIGEPVGAGALQPGAAAIAVNVDRRGWAIAQRVCRAIVDLLNAEVADLPGVGELSAEAWAVGQLGGLLLALRCLQNTVEDTVTRAPTPASIRGLLLAAETTLHELLRVFPPPPDLTEQDEESRE